MKKCPFCAEQIQDDALKCHHCGELVIPDGWRTYAAHYAALNRQGQHRAFAQLAPDQQAEFLHVWEVLSPRLPPTSVPQPEFAGGAFRGFGKLLLWGGLIFIGILILLAGLSTGSEDEPAPDAVSTKAALQYITDGTGDFEDVAWHKVIGSSVYIAFNDLGDVSMLTRSAAWNCSQATGHGCHVWALDASKITRDWTPGAGPFICEAVAREGRVVKSDCGPWGSEDE